MSSCCDGKRQIRVDVTPQEAVGAWRQVGRETKTLVVANCCPVSDYVSIFQEILEVGLFVSYHFAF